jgi:RNA polymerase sigma factor for flagellar operon FliA
MTHDIPSGEAASASRPAPHPAIDEKLVTEHMRLVYHLAHQVQRGYAADADVEELASAGKLGLMEAARNFDPTRGIAFSTFASPRIRGAMMDELRRHDPLPRAVRSRARAAANAREELVRELDREPTSRETAERLGVDLDTYSRWRADAEGAVRLSLDAPLREGDRPSRSPADTLWDDTALAADERINRREEVALLRDAILRLKEQERTVLALYYYEEKKLHEIAVVLDVTESRVSQIRTKALARLRAELAVLRAA